MSRPLGLLVGAVALAAGYHAGAATINVDCNAAPATALGTALAGAGAGDTIEISGTCQQDVTITTSALTLTVKSGDSSLSDGIEGQIEIAGGRDIAINGLLLGVTSGAVIFASPSDQAILYVHDGGSVTLESSSVSNSNLLGILAQRFAQVSLIDSTVLSNGLSFSADTTASPTGFGIRAEDRSSIVFETVASGVLVEFNQGGGVALIDGSSLNALKAGSSSIDSNGGQQILLTAGSSLRASDIFIDGSGCSGGTACGDTIDAHNTSNVRIDGVGGTSFVGALQDHSAVLVSGGSTLLVSGVTLLAPAGAAQVVRASDNSIVVLAGGNMVCSGTCNGSTSGAAMVIDHVSSLIDVAPAQFGYGAGVDQIFGSGQVQLQSTVDLGIGPTGGGAPNLTWNTGSGAAITVAQNSSFRLQGGVSITGGVALGQGSNGFFNTAAGGTNVVSAGVTCPFTAIPSAHVVTGNTSSLSPSPPIAVSFLSASPAAKQCLPF